MQTVYLCDPEKNAECCARGLSCAYNAETPREQRLCISTTNREYALEDGSGQPRLDPRYAERKTT